MCVGSLSSGNQGDVSVRQSVYHEDLSLDSTFNETNWAAFGWRVEAKGLEAASGGIIGNAAEF
jgi:hypothetical protein